jgi:GAF domain-containing protein
MGDPLSVLAELTRLGAPLVAAGHTMGIVALTGKHQDAFDASAEATIAAVAAQAAIASSSSPASRTSSTTRSPRQGVTFRPQ